MRLLGLLTLLATLAVAAPAQAAITDCFGAQISGDPGAGGPALFFMGCSGLSGPPAYTVKTPPAHGSVTDVSDQNGDGGHGGLWHMTYTADDGTWGLSDSWVMHVEDGTGSADFPVTVKIAAAPYCRELVDGRPRPLPVFTLQPAATLDAQLLCTYATNDVTSLSVASQAGHGLAWIQATDGGPSAPRLRYKPEPGFAGTDRFVLALAVGSGSANVPVTVRVLPGASAPDTAAPRVRLTRKPHVTRRAVFFRAHCSEHCKVTVKVRAKGGLRASAWRTFTGTRTIKVPVRAGHRRLRYAITARDDAGNVSRTRRGSVRRKV